MSEAYLYKPKLNKTNAHYPGVPLADLTAAQFEALPAWLRQSIDEAEFYERAPGYEPPAIEEAAAEDDGESGETDGDDAENTQNDEVNNDG